MLYEDRDTGYRFKWYVHDSIVALFFSSKHDLDLRLFMYWTTNTWIIYGDHHCFPGQNMLTNFSMACHETLFRPSVNKTLWMSWSHNLSSRTDRRLTFGVFGEISRLRRDGLTTWHKQSRWAEAQLKHPKPKYWHLQKSCKCQRFGFWPNTCGTNGITISISYCVRVVA